MDFQRLRDTLPERAGDMMDGLWRATGGSDAPLRLCLVGAFSAGKTTLLNCLLGQDLLPVALEESTALPTFVEHGEAPDFRLVHQDGGETVLDQADVRAAVTSPPESARMLVVSLPLPWLDGVQIVDLPGTGSGSGRNAALTKEQMRLADAVAYLLAHRGMDSEDERHLAALHALGKKVFVAVSHWDRVEEAAAAGEQRPDLAAWREAMRYGTGIDCEIVPVSRNGLGHDRVLAFIRGAVGQGRQVREARFAAEAIPLLKGLLQECGTELEALSLDSEQAVAARHAELMEQKRALLELKGRLFEARAGDEAKMADEWARGVEEMTAQLRGGLGVAANAWRDAGGTDAFAADCGRALEETLTQAAVLARSLSEKYGAVDLPEAELVRHGIFLPPPPEIDVNDFVETARYNELKDRLERLEVLEREREGTAPRDICDEEEAGRLRQTLAELDRERRQIMEQPLARVTEVHGSDTWQTIGRKLGDMADIALVAVQPAAAATKVAGMAGRACRGLGMAARTARAVGRGAGMLAKGGMIALQAGRSGMLPQGIADKLGMLDMLTLGHWCEKLGALLDGPKVVCEYTDPEAVRQQQEALRETDDRIRQCRSRLLQLESARTGGGAGNDGAAAIAAIREEMAGLEAERRAELERRTQKADQEIAGLLALEKKNHVGRCLRSFARQTDAMRRLMEQQLARWHEDHVAASIADSEARIDDLSRQLAVVLPEKRQAAEAALRDEMARLEKAIGILSGEDAPA